MKNTVHYVGKPMVLDGFAYLTPIDHTSDLVSNTKLVRTSKVVSYDEATGRLETLNSIYVPVQTVEVWGDTEW